MSTDIQQELQALRDEVRALAEELSIIRDQRSPGRQDQRPLSPDGVGDTDCEQDPEIAALIREAQEAGLKGLVTYRGYFRNEHGSAHWGSRGTAEELLAIDDRTVADVLSTLGHEQRVALLKAILKEPATATELVERLDMGTTGQAYHHLNVLKAADLITQDDRGRFTFRGHRVQSLIMLLAGVRDMVDTRYTAGTWNDNGD